MDQAPYQCPRFSYYYSVYLRIMSTGLKIKTKCHAERFENILRKVEFIYNRIYNVIPVKRESAFRSNASLLLIAVEPENAFSLKNLCYRGTLRRVGRITPKQGRVQTKVTTVTISRMLLKYRILSY